MFYNRVMVHLAAVVLPATYLSSLGALLDSFTLATERRLRMMGADGAEEPPYRLSLLSLDGRDVELGSHARLRVDAGLDAGDRYDLIWLPGFRTGGAEPLRAWLAEQAVLTDWLAAAATRGSLIAASGAAVALPLAAHLADRLPVPVTAALAPVLREIFPRSPQETHLGMMDHGQLLLSRGTAQDLEVISAAFARLYSDETAHWLTAISGVEPEHPHQPQPQDSLVVAAKLRLEQRFTGAVSLQDLAAELCTSPSVLIRRFRRALGMTPSDYIQRLRLTAAQRMLLQTSRSVKSIALALGYSDTRIFRQMFRRATGISATQWRAQNAPPSP